MLTQRQKDLHEFISAHTRRNGYCPSYREMADGIGLKAVSGIERMVRGLEERGFIRRLKGKCRTIEVIKTPEGKKARRLQGRAHDRCRRRAESRACAA